MSQQDHNITTNDSEIVKPQLKDFKSKTIRLHVCYKYLYIS